MSDAADRSDAELATAAATGDERAYAILVGRHKDALYRLLRRYLGDADEAYEAAHEAFIAAWSALGRYDPERPFGAWLRTIAINKARTAARFRRTSEVFFNLMQTPAGAFAPTLDPGRARPARARRIPWSRRRVDRPPPSSAAPPRA